MSHLGHLIRLGFAMQDVTAPHWYVIQCKPRQEWRAVKHLERQGYRCFHPTLPADQSLGAPKSAIPESLFPRYFFIRLHSTQDNWYPIRSTRGVNKLVSCNQRPVPVRDEIIEEIRSRLGEMQSEPYFRSGERVQIDEPPFSRIEAIFVAHDGEDRVILLLSLLQHEQEVSFPVRSVRKMD